MRLLVTGGAGFIGSALVNRLIRDTEHEVLNVDALSYAGSMSNISDVQDHPRHRFLRADICDAETLEKAFDDFSPDAVLHLAAQTHVDRSIDNPEPFIAANINGTFTLLEAVRRHLGQLAATARRAFRFIHVSTDEVYGDSADSDTSTSPGSPYHPSSPYAASKAAGDQLVLAWARTYGLPAIITCCSNNYGPRQLPEKLIPLVIERAASGQTLPLYGNGQQIRDWLYVEDHVTALLAVLKNGRPNARYHIAGGNQISNLNLVTKLCGILDRYASATAPHKRLISMVEDRPGHDRRYALDDSATRAALDWQPEESLDSGLEKTVAWYLKNVKWREQIQSERHSGTRMGLGT